MNLEKLFEMQKVLDERINKGKGLEGRDLLPEKILALQVELGELANEWRGFKFWSTNQTARDQDVECHACKAKGFFDWFNTFDTGHSTETCNYCDGTGIQEKNPLLTEYVDCLHFILSIGLDIETELEYVNITISNAGGVTHQFNDLFSSIAELNYQISLGDVEESEDVEAGYLDAWAHFRSLGVLLDFTWEEIESAYISKNEINHSRQENNY